ncbi:unnamed protein product [Closterium sp. Yama58-4]|nr:unnamed protein product [Closterium sp. Yama58-4]
MPLAPYSLRFSKIATRVAKAGGAATISLQNIPPGYTPEDIREFLLHGADPSEPAWLADLQFFHRTTDPYEEAFLLVFTGIPLPPPPDDPSFSRIPAAIPFEDDSPPVLLNISTHVCAYSGNNHRDSDHETFALPPHPISPSDALCLLLSIFNQPSYL